MDLSAPALCSHGKGMPPDAFILWHVVSSVCALRETVFPHPKPPRRAAAAQPGGEWPSAGTMLQVPYGVCRGAPQKSLGEGGSWGYILEDKTTEIKLHRVRKRRCKGQQPGEQGGGGPKVKAPSRPPKGGAAAVSPEALGAFRLGEGLGAEGPALEVGAGKSQRASHLTSLE